MQQVKEILKSKPYFFEKIEVNFFCCITTFKGYIAIPDFLVHQGVLVQVKEDSPIWIDDSLKPSWVTNKKYHSDSLNLDYYLYHFWYSGILREEVK